MNQHSALVALSFMPRVMPTATLGVQWNIPPSQIGPEILEFLCHSQDIE